jgi:DNA-directed RNA polymerase subunit H (RpoH/RPB5)
MQHTDGDHACLAHAQLNIKRMLDARRIAGVDQDVTIAGDDFLWAMTRGTAYLVVFVTDINKKTLMAVMDFCRPEVAAESNDANDAGNAADTLEFKGVNPTECIDAEYKHNTTHCIIVYRNKCTPTAAKEMQSFEGIQIEPFKMDEVVVCPIDSKLVPEYHLLDNIEAQRVRDKFGESRLPTILTTDPVQRYYNGKVGDIYLVIARFGALQAEYKYRVVREPTT